MNQRDATATPDNPSILPFAESEFADRLERVQSDLRAAGVTATLLVDPENIYWLTGYQSIGYFTFQCLFVPADGRPSLVSRMVNKGLARATPTLDRFVGIEDTAIPVDVLARFLREALPSGATLGIETGAWYFTVRDYHDLIARIDNPIEPCNGFVEAHRIIKTSAQIALMRRAARTAEAGIDAAIKAIAPDKTDNDLAAAMYQATIAAGSEYIGHPPLVVGGERSAHCFATWHRRTLRPGDVVFLENAGCIDRYHSMLARTAILGSPSKLVKSAAETSIAILETAIDAIRPGVTSGNVDAACRHIAEQAGMAEYSSNRVAYAIGIGFPPNWSEGRFLAIRPDDPTVLEPGMTFHIVGGALFLPTFGMMFSDSVLVTDDGCDVLTDYPRALVEVPC
ncbi:MAG: Xaa-Pro peptidase family protein [Proteobacteria bacterium]|nr:Xaa-Pro peptidase family protein [Pseudomonadota bacterium]